MKASNINYLTRQLPLLVVLAVSILGFAQGFSSPRRTVSSPTFSVSKIPTKATTPLFSTTSSEVSYEPVFDFSDPSKDAVSSFDRIDDAIMGGISTSSIRAVSTESGESYASWSGVCRTDGGGFCGTRTLPFQDGKPLMVKDEKESADGFYLKLRLTSDNEPDRRIWKLTTRVENVSRSEQLFQAEFEVPKQTSEEKDWQTIKIPFKSFQQVRGPRLVQNGPPLDVSSGLFQIGMTLSKFQMAANMTTLENFRPGYFEMQIQEIGVYTSDANAVESTTANLFETPKTLTKAQAEKNKPVPLKILGPILKLFFSEKRQRKKSATRLLKKRGMGRLAIASFGFQRKAASRGILIALAQSLLGVVSGLAGFVALWALKITLFYPLVAVRRTMKFLKGGNKKNNPTPQAA